MKKQSGFTLIELMVVMAIISILATAGLSAYTGYIKKARDATRLEDLRAINTIIMGMFSSNGLPPQTTSSVYAAVLAANNNVGLFDPLSGTTGTTPKSVCMDGGSGAYQTNKECYYTYRVCDAGQGYAVGTRFENISNKQLYLDDEITSTGSYLTFPDNSLYEIGNCQTACVNSITGCPTTMPENNVPTKINSTGTSILEAPTP